jgi:hypothetical protein
MGQASRHFRGDLKGIGAAPICNAQMAALERDRKIVEEGPFLWLVRLAMRWQLR